MWQIFPKKHIHVAPRAQDVAPASERCREKHGHRPVTLIPSSPPAQDREVLFQCDAVQATGRPGGFAPILRRLRYCIHHRAVRWYTAPFAALLVVSQQEIDFAVGFIKAKVVQVQELSWGAYKKAHRARMAPR
jgi:hypothetical protein